MLFNRVRHRAVLLCVFVMCSLWGRGSDSVFKGQSQSQAAPPAQAIYDSDPENIWNRLFRLFYVRHAHDGRQYGGDELDPYLWPETKYLLSGTSEHEALQLLDGFLEQHSERLGSDPLKRALFQRDLLAVYDWLTQPPSPFAEPAPSRKELQKRVAKIIRRVALTEDETRKLPDNYDDAIRAPLFPTTYDPANSHRPFLPADLFDLKGPWVCLGELHGRPVASDHLAFFRGRSIFLVFFQVPGGRANTLDYLAKLRDIPKTWGPDSLAGLVPYPVPPQFPIGTRVALVRQMVLIDKNGNPVRTQLTESVQMRVYRALHPDLGGTAQDFLEFRMSRQRLLSEQEGGLRAVAPEERDFAFPLFREHVPGDPFERDTEEPPWRIVLLTCSSCHTFTGIYSFISYSRARFGAGVGTPPKLVGSNPDAEAAVQIGWIAQHYKLALAAP